MVFLYQFIQNYKIFQNPVERWPRSWWESPSCSGLSTNLKPQTHRVSLAAGAPRLEPQYRFADHILEFPSPHWLIIAWSWFTDGYSSFSLETKFHPEVELSSTGLVHLLPRQVGFCSKPRMVRVSILQPASLFTSYLLGATPDLLDGDISLG
jgi:hypothetical protein